MLPDFNKLVAQLNESVDLMRQIVLELVEIKEILRENASNSVTSD